jgi:hypothetical protein
MHRFPISGLYTTLKPTTLSIIGFGFAVITSAIPSPALAAQVYWINWTAGTPSNVLGDIVANGVTYTGQSAFAITGPGTNYWIPNAPYLSSIVSNAPPASDIIAVSLAGDRTFTFNTAVEHLLFAYVSTNLNIYTFDQDFNLISNDTGFWGFGTVTKVDNNNNTWSLITTGGEPHGVIQFKNSFSSLKLNVAVDENWSGFTIGLPENPGNVPSVPGPLPLLGVGAAFGFSRKLRKRIKSSKLAEVMRSIS